MFWLFQAEALQLGIGYVNKNHVCFSLYRGRCSNQSYCMLCIFGYSIIMSMTKDVPFELCFN
jgi:hypothetical protein